MRSGATARQIADAYVSAKNRVMRCYSEMACKQRDLETDFHLLLRSDVTNRVIYVSDYRNSCKAFDNAYAQYVGARTAFLKALHAMQALERR